MSAKSFSSIDASAVGLSAACLIHCLALPILAAALPAMGVLADNEQLHAGFVILAVLVSGLAIGQSLGGGVRWGFIIVALTGLGFLVAGAFFERLEAQETMLTVIGALLLAGAHVWRWRRHTRTA